MFASLVGKEMRLYLFIIIVGLFFGPRAVCFADWPGFQGPGGDNVSEEKNLVRFFSPGGARILWSADVGPGFGGCSVHRGEVFIFDRVAGAKDVLRCIDLESGKSIWTHESPQPGKLSYPGSRTVPAVNNTSVFCVSGFGRVLCIDRETHKPVWTILLGEKYPTEVPMFGYSHSPVLWKDQVIVAPLSPAAGLVALESKTGHETWRIETPLSSCMTSSHVRIEGMDQVVFISSNREAKSEASPSGSAIVHGIDPDSGRILWKYDNFRSLMPVATVTQVETNRLLVTEGYTPLTVLLEISGDQGTWSASEVFRIERGSHLHPAVYYEGYIYLLVNNNSNQRGLRWLADGGLLCLNLRGEVLWRTGNQPNLGRGCMLLADGMLISQDGRSGHLRLIEPGPEKYVPLAEANLFGTDGPREDLQMWSPLALADGRLLIRSQSVLHCVDLRAP